MIKNIIKSKLLSCFLAGALAACAIGAVPPAEAYAEEIKEIDDERMFGG